MCRLKPVGSPSPMEKRKFFFLHRCFLEVSPADSMRQSSSSAPFTFKTGHKIAISIGVLLVLLAIGGLVVYLRRRPTHQRLYGDSDHDTLNNVGGRGRYRADSFGESMLPRRVLDRSYYNTRLSPLSDDGASSITPLLRTQSESPVLERDQLFSDMSRGSLTILPAAPILRQPRPLPKPRNPRPLVPQRRWNSIQVRMQKKPPLISSFPNATHPLPLSSISIPSSAPSSSSPAQPSSSPTLTSLRNIKPLPPVLDTSLPPLMPQRRTEEKINAAFSSYSPQADLSPATPLRPTPSISSFADTNSTASKTSRHRGLRRKQPHVRNRSGQLELTSESFRCVGERGWNE